MSPAHVLRHLLVFIFMATALSSCLSSAPSISSTDSENYAMVTVTPELIAQLRKDIGIGKESSIAAAENESTSSDFDYKIGIGDILVSRFYFAGQDDFNYRNQVFGDTIFEGHQAVVKDDGTASFPYVGEVKLLGQTLPEAKKNLNKAMGRYFKNPQVTLDVKEYRSNKLFVMGEVIRPASLSINSSRMTLAEAINQSQGMNPNTASYAHLYVIRSSGQAEANIEHEHDAVPSMRTTVYYVDAASAVGLAMAGQFPLKPYDVVYVSPTAISEWGKIISQLLPAHGASANASYTWGNRP